MKGFGLTIALAGSAGLAACATYPAAAPVPVASNGVCGNYGYVDSNNDGMISGTEWNAFRAGSYGYWDTNRDGRIDRTEFQACYSAGGFYRDPYWRPADWNYYYTGFDANHDGYIDANEYWSATVWARADRNHNGILDSNEWNWWEM